jgi:hypothetical protein
MPVDKNSEAYKKAIKDMADIVSTKGIRIVGNFFEYDGRFPDAVKAVTSLPFKLTRLTDLSPDLGPDLKTLPPYAGLDLDNKTVYEGEPFDSLSHRGRITFAETNPTLRNQWIEALRDVEKELSASGRTANITDLSEEKIRVNKNRHEAIKLMVNWLLITPGIRVRGNVVEMDTKSNIALSTVSQFAYIAGLFGSPHQKHPMIDSEPSSGPAPTIVEQKTCGGVYFTNDAHIARMTIGRFSPEVRADWKIAMQEVQLRASAIGGTIDYQDAPDVATDPDGPGCLSVVPKAALDWVRKMAGKPRGSGGRDAG